MTTNDKINITKFDSDFLRGTHIDIYGDDFDTEIHPGKYFIHLYNEICYCYTVNTDINIKNFISELTENYNITDDDYILKEEQANHDNIKKIDYVASQYLIKIKEKLLLEVHNHKIVFWYSPTIEFTEITKMFDLIKRSKRRKQHNRKFYMIAASSHSEFGFFLQEFDVKKIKVDINENYNDDFNNVHEIIETFFKTKNQNGLVLLHGKYGTGKTTYLRHTISNINKRFIFLPLDLMDAISSPNFLPFISEYKDSILILEDCEELLAPRETSKSGNNSLANLLNLGDGLLSDALSIKIICTFNAELKKIDKAILRKGRLVARYEFKELDIPKAQALSDKAGNSITIDKPLTLAEIYNQDSDDFSDMNNNKKLGF